MFLKNYKYICAYSIHMQKPRVARHHRMLQGLLPATLGGAIYRLTVVDTHLVSTTANLPPNGAKEPLPGHVKLKKLQRSHVYSCLRDLRVFVL